MQIEEKIIKKDNITQIFTGEPLVRSISKMEICRWGSIRYL